MHSLFSSNAWMYKWSSCTSSIQYTCILDKSTRMSSMHICETPYEPVARIHEFMLPMVQSWWKLSRKANLCSVLLHASLFCIQKTKTCSVYSRNLFHSLFCTKHLFLRTRNLLYRFRLRSDFCIVIWSIMGVSRHCMCLFGHVCVIHSDNAFQNPSSPF